MYSSSNYKNFCKIFIVGHMREAYSNRTSDNFVSFQAKIFLTVVQPATIKGLKWLFVFSLELLWILLPLFVLMDWVKTVSLKFSSKFKEKNAK